MDRIAGNEPVSVFDFNGNGRIDFADASGSSTTSDPFFRHGSTVGGRQSPSPAGAKAVGPARKIVYAIPRSEGRRQTWQP